MWIDTPTVTTRAALPSLIWDLALLNQNLPLNLHMSYFMHIIHFSMLLEWPFQTFLFFHPSAQISPDCLLITATWTLGFESDVLPFNLIQACFEGCIGESVPDTTLHQSSSANAYPSRENKAYRLDRHLDSKLPLRRAKHQLVSSVGCSCSEIICVYLHLQARTKN